MLGSVTVTFPPCTPSTRHTLRWVSCWQVPGAVGTCPCTRVPKRPPLQQPVLHSSHVQRAVKKSPSSSTSGGHLMPNCASGVQEAALEVPGLETEPNGTDYHLWEFLNNLRTAAGIVWAPSTPWRSFSLARHAKRLHRWRDFDARSFIIPFDRYNFRG